MWTVMSSRTHSIEFKGDQANIFQSYQTGVKTYTHSLDRSIVQFLCRYSSLFASDEDVFAHRLLIDFLGHLFECMTGLLFFSTLAFEWMGRAERRLTGMMHFMKTSIDYINVDWEREREKVREFIERRLVFVVRGRKRATHSISILDNSRKEREREREERGKWRNSCETLRKLKDEKGEREKA